MFNPITQYIFTAIVVIVAVIYVAKMIKGNKDLDDKK